MYLLPEKLELNELVGQLVIQVCVGPYDAQVHFDNDYTIQSLFRLEGEENGKKSLWFENEWIDTSHVKNITDEVVTAIHRVSDTELRIELTNNHAICFHTEESQYESLNISLSNGSLEII